MTLTLEMNPQEEARLAAASRQTGLPPTEMLRKLMADNLPTIAPDGMEDPTLALFAQWDEEDSHMTPEEIDEARREFEEFKQGINAERALAGARIIYP